MKKFARVAAALLGGALLLSACGGSGEEGGDKTYKIGIAQFVSHPSLDAATKGFKDELADAGIKVEYTEQNPQADQATATSIASTFASSNFDLTLAVATPMAQALAQADGTTPILFTAVTDAVAAELVDSNDKPGHNLSGTSDMNPVADQIALIKQIDPDAKSVGIIYSSGEVNSEIQVKLAKEAAEKEGLKVQEASVTSSAEVPQAAESLTVDAIYVPTDNVVVSGLESVIGVCEQRQTLLIAGESDSVARGAVATYGIDYEKLGRQTGKMAIKILVDGADPAEMPVETQEELGLVINEGAAERMGVTISEEIKSKAESVG